MARSIKRMALLVAVFGALSSAILAVAQKPGGASPKPEAAIRAILAAFDKYEVVGMPAAHGQKDMDDFILALIRNPVFAEKVNDIEVECGNSLYQPLLDRYIAGEDVPFKEVQKVWRNTTQEMCGLSGFYEEFFPLVRAINQTLPAKKRLRVLAGDPPIDWDQVKTFADYSKFDRGASIAPVMEKEVLSKHRKALMLFGTFHLFHGTGSDVSRYESDVSRYEKDYPNVTFVISDTGQLDADLFKSWAVPSLARIKGTSVGSLGIERLFEAPVMMDSGCHAKNTFPIELQKPIEELVDAVLYLGPRNLSLKEPLPADIALDTEYMTELQKRGNFMGHLGGGPQGLEEFSRRIVNSASDPVPAVPKPPDLKAMEKNCLERMKNKPDH